MKTILDKEQTEAVNSNHPTILCMASPGSGKTRVLVERIKRLIGDGFKPERIVAITFTNAGAKEIQDRLKCPVCGNEGFSHEPPCGCGGHINYQLGFVGTLHSFCLRLLQKHGSLIGLPKTISVLDEDSADALLEQCRQDLRVKCTKKALKESADKFFYPPFQVVLDRSTGAELVISDFIRKMIQTGELTFDYILCLALKLIATNPQVIEFDALLVDEFQDSARIDANIYNAMFACVHKCFIGDIDQNIYSFRGASIEPILDLANKDDVQVIRLVNNYRSTSKIVRASQALIGNNASRFDYEAKAIYKGKEHEINVSEFEMAIGELSFIASMIQSSKKSETCAVLFRTNKLVDQARQHFEGLGIKLSKQIKNKTEPEVVMARALLAFLSNPYSDRSALRWIELSLGDEYAKKARAEAALFCTSVVSAMGKARGSQLFVSQGCGNLVEIANRVHAKQETIRWLIELMRTMPEGFTIQDLAIAANRQEETVQSDGVHVGTVHSAKGLEFDVVFMAASESDLWDKQDEMEESRRLFYVGITRAKRRLFITGCSERQNPYTFRMEQKIPTRFIEEMALNGN